MDTEEIKFICEKDLMINGSIAFKAGNSYTGNSCNLTEGDYYEFDKDEEGDLHYISKQSLLAHGKIEVQEDNTQRHYFVSFSARRIIEGTFDFWNQVINISPADFILSNSDDEYYKDFHIVSIIEVSREEYEKHKDSF